MSIRHTGAREQSVAIYLTTMTYRIVGLNKGLFSRLYLNKNDFFLYALKASLLAIVLI